MRHAARPRLRESARLDTNAAAVANAIEKLERVVFPALLPTHIVFSERVAANRIVGLEESGPMIYRHLW